MNIETKPIAQTPRRTAGRPRRGEGAIISAVFFLLKAQLVELNAGPPAKAVQRATLIKAVRQVPPLPAPANLREDSIGVR